MIDKGSKFIPCIHLSEFDILRFVITNFENNLNRFNSLIQIHKNKSIEETANLTENINLNLDSCNFIDCFSKKLKCINNTFSKLKFNVNKECLDFKFNFYKSLPFCSFAGVMNISFSELKCMKDFIRNKPFKIIDCDKNIGICFISNTNYDKFVTDNLSDTNTYKILELDPLDNIKLKINKKINELVSAKTLS